MKSKDLRLLFSMNGGRTFFAISAIAAILNTAIIIANGFLVASIVIGIINRSPSLPERILELAALWLGRAFFNAIFDRWASHSAARFKEELRINLLSTPEILISNPSTFISNLLIKGMNSLDVYFGRFLPQILSSAITPISVIVTLLILDPLSALIATLTLPLIPIFGALIGLYTKSSVEAKWNSLGTLSKYFEDSLRGIHTLSIFSRLDSQGQRIAEMGDRYTKETMKVLRISFLSALALELAATISVALIAVAIGLRLVHGSMDFYPALVVLVLAAEVYLPLRNAATLFHASVDGGTTLQQAQELKDAATTGQLLGRKEISSIDSITWSEWRSPHGEHRGRLPCQDLFAGEVLVIRGQSGIGKSTFITSLLGFGDSSRILINQSPLATFDRRSLHSLIGWIPQLPTLTSGSIRDLFAQVDASLSDSDLMNLLARVGLAMDAIPDGLDTQLAGLGEKSSHLSGGQIRRIAIARALAVNPSLIIADEPTADLDHNSAMEVLTLLGELSKKGVTVIAILHLPDHRIEGAREIEMVAP
jgi:ABC-type transport system involved in cytochrome bd biosynthesis fused ATPase/permease subunit